MEIATIVLIVLNVIFGLCILLGFLWGLKRGIKKSALRIAFIAGALIVAFGISIPITKALITMDISSIVNTTGPNGEPITSLQEFITSTITSNEDIAEAYNNSESFRAFVDALPQMLLQCIVFVILFWVLKLITWIIYAIIAKAVWGKKRKSKEEKLQEKQENRTVENGKVIENGNVRPVAEKPVKKHRLAGAAVGTLQGLLIAFFTMIPLAGIASMMGEIDKSSTKTASASTTDNPLSEMQPLGDMLRESMGDDIVDALLAYDKSALGVICGWTGVDDLAFDIQSSAKIGDSTTSLRKEVISIVDAYSQAQQINSLDLSTLDFDTVQKLFDSLFNSKALTNIANDLLPYYVNKTLNDPNANLQPELKSVLQMYVDNYNTPSIYDLQNDLNSIITAMKVIQSNDIFAVIEDENFSIDSLISVLEDNGDKTPIKDIFVALTNSTTLQNFLQVGINYALDIVSEELTKINGSEITVKHAEFNNVDWTAVNNEIPTILNNLIDLYKEIKDDKEVGDIIAHANFVNIGKTLEIFSSSTLLNEAYDNTITALNKVEAYTKYIDFEALKSDIDFEKEFTYIQNTVDALIAVDAINLLTNSQDIKLFIEALGQNVTQSQTCIDIVADNLTKSTILRASAPRALNTLYENNIQPSIDIIIDKINETNIQWNNEKYALTTLFNFVSANADYFLGEINVENIVKNVDLTQLGVSLDAMKNSALLYPIYKVGIELAKDNAEVQKYINVDKISVDTNWTEELTALQNALNEVKTAGILDVIFEENGIQQTLNIISNDSTIIENIIDNLFNSTILQNSVDKLINNLQDLIANQLSITIEPTTVDIDDFIANLSIKKQEFSNIINNIAVVASPIMENSFNLDTFANNIDNFALAFDSLQTSAEFKNTYNGIINYLATNETINAVIDFSVVGDNFDYITEFNKLETIINKLKDNNIWTPLVDGSQSVDEALDTLDADTKAELIELILDSKLFSGLAVDTLNQMIEEFNGYLGTTIAPIPDGTDLSSQKESIASVTKYLLELTNSGMTDIVLNDINLSSLGDLLTALKDNKFVYNGVLTEVYEEFVNYMTNDANYGYLIIDACKAFDEDNMYANANQNINVDWVSICQSFNNLLQVESSLNDINNLTANDLTNVLNTIGNHDNLTQRLAKTFLKNGKADEDKQIIDNFDFADTEFNTQAINIIYELQDLDTQINSDLNTALDTLSTTLNDLGQLNRVKLDNLILFVDVVTDSDYGTMIEGTDFTQEAEVIQEFKSLLNFSGELTIDILTNSVKAFNDSTLALNELSKNNVVICDIQSRQMLDALKKSISNTSGIPTDSITDQNVIDAVNEIITNNVEVNKQDKIRTILNLI